ncbi:MAG: hypothetical protein ACRC4N_17210 [Gammaproteobacteria bacterium]
MLTVAPIWQPQAIFYFFLLKHLVKFEESQRGILSLYLTTLSAFRSASSPSPLRVEVSCGVCVCVCVCVPVFAVGCVQE